MKRYPIFHNSFHLKEIFRHVDYRNYLSIPGIEQIKQFVIDLWKNMPAELKEKNKDADIMALIEAAKTPPGPKPQAKPADLPCLIGTKPARPYAGDEEIDSRTIVSRRITTLRHSLKVHVTATTVRREVVEDAVFLLSSASSVSKDYNIRRIAASLSELTEQERTEVKARLEADKTLLDNKVSYRPNGAEETVEFTLREFMEYSFNGTLEEEYKTAKH